MKPIFTSEEQILDPSFRAQVIREISSNENVDRKNMELRKYEVYKDQTKKWAIELLARELKRETVAEMEKRATNVSICRKIINKLAQCYVNGVVRTVPDEGSQVAMDFLAEHLRLNSVMKKVDRYSELFHNTMLQIVPYLCEDAEEGPQYDLQLKVLPPHAYDVIEDPKNKEKPKVVILTDFVERNQRTQDNFFQPGSDGRNTQGIIPNFHQGDRKEQTIADSPEDAGQENREYIFWSPKYHFTCNGKGEILVDKSPEGNLNPIQALPFVNFAGDQDGQFWARGGDDLVDGAVLINVLLTDMNAIANVQGWGQLVIKGKNVPTYIQGGPHTALKMEYEKDDPVPDVQFVSSNPPLDIWMQMIEQHVALLLSTNNLSPASVAGKLDAANFPSGIAMLIEQSESTAEVQDKQRLFKDAEPQVWRILKKWIDVYAPTGQLEEKLSDGGSKLLTTEVNLKFMNPKPVISEKEKLETLKMRQELGISTIVDLILMDNPDLTEEEAEKKALEISKENMERAAKTAAMVAESVMNGDKDGEQSDDDKASSDPKEMADEEEAKEEKQMNGDNVGVTIEESLNGAQITSVVDLVQSVASGTMPRDSAVSIIEVAFKINRETAEKMIGTAGSSFKIKTEPEVK